ncbi:DUF433 domain-containing protein [Botrimarina sp.]|uniref:DUF433 domain-containing protein n=1 Tax=Botrimarina sp. TaxID=2795802 RepID=UPI0032EE339A
MHSTLPQYVELRPTRRGEERPFVVGTRVRVQDIVILHERFGATAEDIAGEHFPHLTLAQVYAALAFFHEHREAVWKQIHEDASYAESLREQLTVEQAADDRAEADAGQAEVSP